MAVFASDEQSALEVDLPRWLRLARLVLDEERAPADAEVSLIFVDEESIADLNGRFLGGDGPTDVLSFPIDDDLPSGRHPDTGGRGPGTVTEPGDPPLVLGDVVVCPTVAARQAPTHAGTVDDEIALLVVHGVLHLLDYDHAEPSEADVMRRREQELLMRFREMEQRS
jgi:probable rRNA maturation factor